METNDYLEYIKVVKNYFELDDSLIEKNIILDLAKPNLKNEFDLFINAFNKTPIEWNGENHFNSAVLYGYRINAETIDCQTELIEKTINYETESIWNYSLDSLLNLNTTSNDESIENIMSWLINPGQTINLYEDVFEQLCCKTFNVVYKYIDQTDKLNYKLMLPFFSKDIDDLQINKILEKICPDETLEVEIENFGSLLSIEKHERYFLVCTNSQNDESSVIVGCYESYRGENVLVGAIGFIQGDSTLYELQSLPKQIVRIHKKEPIENTNNDKKKYIKIEMDSVKSKLPTLEGYKAFLSNHISKFYDTQYLYVNDTKETNELISFVKKGMKLSPAQIGVKNNNSTKLNEISLNDMIYITNLIEKEDSFVSTELKTKKKIYIESSKNIEHIANKFNQTLNIPLNYDSFEWELCEIRDYFNYDNLTNENSVEEQIYSILNFYGHTSTTEIAEELLFLENDRTDTLPSAYMIYNLFYILSNLENVKVIRKDEVRELPNEKKLDIQKTIKYKGLISNKSNTKSIIRNNNILIEEAQLTKRTYNCLKRAGYYSLNQLVGKTESDLMKIRNLGRRGVNEIFAKLESYGFYK